MKKRWSAVTIATLLSLALLFVLLGVLAENSGHLAIPVLAAAPSQGRATSTVTTPTVTAVEPSQVPNDIATPIVIYGTGFTATLSGTVVLTAPTVVLGENLLPDVIWVNTTTISATVPWGLTPDVYSMTVINSDGVSSTLQNAFTVTEAFGEFVTGGPYGGMAVQLALNPGVSSTVYASMFGAGLFISENAAENWVPIHDHDWPIQFDFDSQDPNVIYFGADSNDLYRSIDNGGSWERISGDFHTQHGCFRTYPAAHSSLTGTLYFGMGGCADINLMPGEGGVFYSTDYGNTWISRTQGLSDLDIQALAINPNDPDTLLAGTFDGDVFYSTNGGVNWTWSTQLTGTVARLYFNPYEALQAWAATSSEAEGRGYLYRSTNLMDWTTSDTQMQLGGGSVQMQMAFLPGSVWVASTGVYSSTDSGATWHELDGLNKSAMAMAIPPDDPQTIYVGTDFGIEKSTDGGETWQEMYEGLAALVPEAVAVSSADPDVAYVKTHQGLFVSHNGGNTWQNLDQGTGGGPGGSVLAVDPFDGTRLYLRSQCPNEFCIEISPDGGATWTLVTSTLPVTYTGWSCSSSSIAPSPHIPGEVLVGAVLSPPSGGDDTGIFYRSDDYGASWSYIVPTEPISPVSEIAYDAFDPNLIYAGTETMGLWRSTNGGDAWEHLPISDMAPPVSVPAIAIHPDVPNKVYLRSYSSASTPNPEPELWVSDDAGETWQSLTYVFLGVDLLVAPPLPGQPFYSLYTGCEAGLCRSMDDGATWSSIQGIPRPEILVGASDGERSLVYMGTPGGLATSSGGQTALSRDTIPGRGTVLGGGVYRLTTLLPRHWVYLPLVMRGPTP